MNKPTLIALSSLCAIAFVTTAQADIAFTDFPAGMLYSQTGGFGVEGANTPDGYYSVGMQFTSAVTGNLDSITTAMFSTPSDPTTMTFLLYADNGQNQFGNLLFAQTINPSLPTTGGLVSATNSNLPAQLVAGQNYWVDIIASPNTSNLWCFSYNASFANIMAFSHQLGGSESYSSGRQVSLQVTTQSVPEPASFAALGIGLLGLMIRRRR